MITLTREEAQQVLDALYSMNGTEFLCQAAHHPKKDMHKSGEVCPVAERYTEARETLRAVIAKATGEQQ
jgi:2-iminoacetate synthase ThiH